MKMPLFIDQSNFIQINIYTILRNVKINQIIAMNNPSLSID